MRKWKHYFTMYWLLQKQNMKALLEYRADFLIMMFFTVLSQGCNLAVIGIIYSNIPAVGGWKFGEVLLLYGFLLFTEGSINFFFQGAWKITQMINQAEIDRYIIRPLPLGFQMLTSRIDFDGLNKMGIGVAVFVYGASQCDIQWSVKKMVILLLSVVLACLIRACLIWIASCTSFWLEGTKNHVNFFVSTIGDMAKYPLTIYPPLLKGVFAYVIPYAFISYYPMGYLLGKEGMEIGVCLLPVVLGVVFFAAKIQLRAGMARYESSGN